MAELSQIFSLLHIADIDPAILFINCNGSGTSHAGDLKSARSLHAGACISVEPPCMNQLPLLQAALSGSGAV